MKITKSQAKQFVEAFYKLSKVALDQSDVLECLEKVFAEMEKVESKENDQKLELTEESIRQMIEKYLGKVPTKPWPQPDTIPYGVDAYMCSFPGSTFTNGGAFTTCSSQEFGSASNTESELGQVQPRYGVSFKKDNGFQHPNKKE